MKTLVLDIETTPFLSYHFKQWKTDIYPANVVQAPEVLCFAWKWHGEPGPVGFVAGRYHPDADPYADDDMAAQAYDLLTTAEAVVTFNGDVFDLGHLNRLASKGGWGPPSPYKSVDLRKVAKAKFQFAYNSLDYICSDLGIGSKMSHPGLPMWVGCMGRDTKSWTRMERYNKRDVKLTDKLYAYLLPWISGHPNVALVDRLGHACTHCGGKLIRQGFKHNRTGSYQRYQCLDCGAWSQDTHRSESVRISDATA